MPAEKYTDSLRKALDGEIYCWLYTVYMRISCNDTKNVIDFLKSSVVSSLKGA